MDVSVVVCTHNRAKLLGRTLAALRDQCTAAGLTWELVLVDNNSSDGTRSVVSAATVTFPVPARYVFEPRLGLSHARNAGIENAKGDIIAFTDDDCRPEPAWVQNVVDGMQRWSADGLGGRILPEWSSPPPSWLATDRHQWTSIAMLDDSAVRRVELGPWQREHGFRVWGANMAFRRSAFETVKGFDTNLGTRGKKRYSHEDIMFVRQLVEAGKVVMFDPAPIVHHWVGPERLQKRFFRRHSFDYGEGSAFRNGPPEVGTSSGSLRTCWAPSPVTSLPGYVPRFGEIQRPSATNARFTRVWVISRATSNVPWEQVNTRVSVDSVFSVLAQRNPAHRNELARENSVCRWGLPEDLRDVDPRSGHHTA